MKKLFIFLLLILVNIINGSDVNQTDLKHLEERSSSSNLRHQAHEQETLTFAKQEPIVARILDRDIFIFNELFKNIKDKNIIEQIQKEIKNGFDINTVDKFNNSLLMYACSLGSFRLIDFLLKLPNINVNFQTKNNKKTALIYAIERFGTLEKRFRDKAINLIELFLKCKFIDINLKNKNGKNALNIAEQTYQSDIVELIRKFEHYHLFHSELAENISIREINDETIVNFIVENADFIDKSYNYKNGNNLLSLGVEYNRFNLVYFLITELKLNTEILNAQNMAGDTALMIAVRNNNKEMTEYLLMNGADFKLINKEGKTARKIAQDQGNKEICEIFNRYVQKIIDEQNTKTPKESVEKEIPQLQDRWKCVII